MSLRSRAKVQLARQLCRPFVGRLVGSLAKDLIPSRGTIIDTSSPYVLPEVKARLFWRLYESSEIRFIQRYLPANLDVIELGSSLGAVSAQIARRLAPGRRLICVEANPGLRGLASRNVHLNVPQAVVNALEAAIAYGTETVRFEIGRTSTDSRVGSAGVEVPAIRLGQVLEHTGIGEYALVSDIEGAEAGIIVNDAAALGRCRFIVAELHATVNDGTVLSVDELLARLLSLGFILVARHGPVIVARR